MYQKKKKKKKKQTNKTKGGSLDSMKRSRSKRASLGGIEIERSCEVTLPTQTTKSPKP
jgi:hypothetical protein